MKMNDQGKMEMEMEMEMVAAENIRVGEDITLALSPISYSLHDSFLPSHCASCFSPLPNNHNPLNHQDLCYYYCSPSCSSSSSSSSYSPPLHISSDLRVALLLLLQIKRLPPIQSYLRICGLISNRHTLLTSTNDDSLPTTITNGAREMAALTSTSTSKTDGDFLLEEAVLCAVLTNAVEVQDTVGRSVGIAVYDTSFSWINHSCSPNACYRFLSSSETQCAQQRCLITPAAASSQPFHLLTGSAAGPRLVVRSIKMINKGEPVTISYTDLLQPKELRRSELWSKYRFTCCCPRCVALPLTYVDHRLQEITCGSTEESLTEYIDDVIRDYLSSNPNDAESYCKKLEDALFSHEIRLHPQNHLCLDAYTTLASAYSSASAIATEDEDGFKKKRFSVAYSLLLALLTHDLYLHESSLVASVSNFWIGAGESLINLATCFLVSSGSSALVLKCECGLIDIFEEEANFEVLKEQVFKCIMRGGKLWRFLVVGNGYLEAVKDPMFAAAESGSSVSNVDLYGLGAHCILLGGILSNISGGHNSHLSCYVRRLLYRLSL